MDRNFVCLWRRHNCNWYLPFCADLLIYESNYCFLKQFYLHAKVCMLLIINLWVKKIYFAVLEEIYNNVVPHCHWSAVLISCNHSITLLISFTKTLQIRDQFFLYMDYGPSLLGENLSPGAKAFRYCMYNRPEFVNVLGAQESIPRNGRWPIYPISHQSPNFLTFKDPRIEESIPLAYLPGGPVRQPYSHSVPRPHRLFKNSSTVCAQKRMRRGSWNL
jgi:hypothetical protein